MSYKTFISHGSNDNDLIDFLYYHLQLNGIEAYLAERDIRPNSYLSEKVIRNLKNSDSAIILLTRDGIDSNYVQNEVGIAIGSNIPIIPIVEKGIRQEELAVLQGREYIELNPDYYNCTGLSQAIDYLISLKKKKEQANSVLALIGIGTFIAIAAK